MPLKPIAGACRAYIGLGSNLNDPPAQLRRALDALASLKDSRLGAVSSLYRSAPVGPPAQPDYVNAVAALDTALAPLALLDALQAIEQAQGRVRGERWGARTLDLDILLYGGEVIQHERLGVPHAEMRKRAFVLWPLYDIAPELILPDGTALERCLSDCPFVGLERLT